MVSGTRSDQLPCLEELDLDFVPAMMKFTVPPTLVVVYGNGTDPDDIDIGNTVPATIQPGPPMINDPLNRVYRGIDPTVLPLLQGPPQGPAQPRLHDRVEVVHFPEPGRYLVICGVLPHFLEHMYGFVKVNP